MPITMREVAKAAGVSVTTVSYVLTQRPGVVISTPTRERVLAAARRLNYRYNAHAADLRRGATRIVGIQLYSLGVSILARKVAALERELRQAQLSPLLCHASDREAEQSFFEECASRRVCGVVLTAPPDARNYDLLRHLMAEGIGVLSSEPVPGLAIPYVTVDRGMGAETAVRHLLSLGHRRIALVVGFTGQARQAFRDGYARALANAGTPSAPELLHDLHPTAEWHEAGEAAIEQLLSVRAPPTAVVTTDDEVAIGALRALRRRGLRVPEDVALVGCDDIPAAAFADLPLTTLAHPAEETGRRLGGLFLEGLQDPKRIADRQIALPLRLIVRKVVRSPAPQEAARLPGYQ